MIYILLSGVPPFWAETEHDIFEEVLHGDLDFSSDPWPNISESAKDLVRKMLVRDPKKRLTAHEVLCELLCSIFHLFLLIYMKRISLSNLFTTQQIPCCVMGTSLFLFELIGLSL
ncbi:hypothetical protein CsSME_00046359 [Camellia sinensis var. sinensis]